MCAKITFFIFLMPSLWLNMKVRRKTYGLYLLGQLGASHVQMIFPRGPGDKVSMPPGEPGKSSYCTHLQRTRVSATNGDTQTHCNRIKFKQLSIEFTTATLYPEKVRSGQDMRGAKRMLFSHGRPSVNLATVSS